RRGEIFYVGLRCRAEIEGGNLVISDLGRLRRNSIIDRCLLHLNAVIDQDELVSRRLHRHSGGASNWDPSQCHSPYKKTASKAAVRSDDLGESALSKRRG